VLPIEKIEHGQVSVKGLDCLNDTQLLDIKPAIFLEALQITEL
jgi:tRNA (Thr-GGU) A37 N-methylase